MYIQPCCIDKELPPIAKQPVAYFQSNGDWLLSDLLSSIAYLVPGSVCLITIPEVDVYLLRTLNTYLEKGWFSALMLVTNINQTELVRGELGKHIDRVQYGSDSHLLDGCLALTNFGQHLVVLGPLLLTKDFTYCQYSSSYARTPDLYGQAIESITPKLKLSATIRSKNEWVQKILKRDYSKPVGQ